MGLFAAAVLLLPAVSLALDAPSAAKTLDLVTFKGGKCPASAPSSRTKCLECIGDCKTRCAAKGCCYDGSLLLEKCYKPPSPPRCTGASVRLEADQCAAWGEFWDSAGGPHWVGKGQNCSKSDPCACGHGVECGPKTASSNCAQSDSCDSSITAM